MWRRDGTVTWIMERHQEWLKRWRHKAECPQTKDVSFPVLQWTWQPVKDTFANSPHAEGWFCQGQNLTWPFFSLDSSLGVNPSLVQAVCPLHSNPVPALEFPTKRFRGTLPNSSFYLQKGALSPPPRTALPVGSKCTIDPRHLTCKMDES